GKTNHLGKETVLASVGVSVLSKLDQQDSKENDCQTLPRQVPLTASLQHNTDVISNTVNEGIPLICFQRFGGISPRPASISPFPVHLLFYHSRPWLCVIAYKLKANTGLTDLPFFPGTDFNIRTNEDTRCYDDDDDDDGDGDDDDDNEEEEEEKEEEEEEKEEEEEEEE
ncbi:hypothetical protein STEG23_031713, partial [Scotinomys teguina]